MDFHVKITTTEKDINRVLSSYDLGELKSSTNLSFGYANENFKVSTQQTDILFRVCKQQSKDDIEKEIALMKELMKIQFPTSYPIADKKGNYIHQLNDNFCVIYQFITGKQPEINKESAGEIGKAAAMLSQVSVENSFRKNNAITIDNCFELIKEFPIAKFQYNDIYSYFIEQTFFLQNYVSYELPKGIIHGDYFPDNTIFEKGKLKAVIDFEEFAYDTLLFDLGMAINGFCFIDNELKTDLLEETIKSYNQIRKLSTKEIELLPYYIQWAAHGMLYWHLRNNMLFEENKTQVLRVMELMDRVKKLRK